MRPVSLATKSASETLALCVRKTTALIVARTFFYAMIELGNQHTLVLRGPLERRFTASPLSEQRSQYKSVKSHERHCRLGTCYALRERDTGVTKAPCAKGNPEQDDRSRNESPRYAKSRLAAGCQPQQEREHKRAQAKCHP